MLPADLQLRLVRTADDVADLQRWLGERREIDAIGFDTETSGLNTRTDRVRLIQFGDLRTGWAMARDEWLGLARWVLDTWQGDLIAHNAPFDTSMLANSCGIDLPRRRVQCTFTMARINEPTHAAGLKNQAVRHVDPAAAGLATVLADTDWTWANVPTDYGPYWQYGALDPVLAYALYLHHRPIVDRECPRSYDLELAAAWVLERMQATGIHVDRELAAQKSEEFQTHCLRLSAWVRERYGISAGSDVQVLSALKSFGFEFPKLTASGRREALDKDVLEGVDHPLARAVLQRRQLLKISTTYLDAFLELADGDGLVHPGINAQGARTSRMSMEEPNLQNLPVRGTNPAGEWVRRCIDSRYGENGRLVLCDFDQIEMRLLAHLSEDPALIRAFHTSEDFFVQLGRQIFDDPTLVKSDPRRQLVKNASYANAYGAGIDKFARTAGIPFEQGQAFLQRYEGLYPGVPRLKGRVLAAAKRRLDFEGDGYVRSPLTNRKWVADRTKLYALVNYLIQGVAAEVFKRQLVELDAMGLGEYLCLPVHDEVILDVPAAEAADVARAVRVGMTDATTFRVPITAGVSVGANWRDKEEWIDA